MTVGKKILIGGVVAGAGIGGYCLYVQHVCKSLVITHKVSLLSLDLKNIKLKVSINIKNPAMFGFSFTKPFITIKHKDERIYASDPSDEVIKIPGSGTKQLDDMIIEIPLLQAVSIAASAISLGSIGSFLKKAGQAIAKLAGSVKMKEPVELIITIDTRLVIIKQKIEIGVPTIEQKIVFGK